MPPTLYICGWQPYCFNLTGKIVKKDEKSRLTTDGTINGDTDESDKHRFFTPRLSSSALICRICGFL
jgi:hypothetical protein